MEVATDFPKLEADKILSRIDKQREMLHLSRNEVASIAGINQLSFINNFKKHKVPKFNDLYRISNAIGITFDSLVAENDPEYLLDKNNNPLFFVHGFFKHSQDAHVVRTIGTVGSENFALNEFHDFGQCFHVVA